MDRVDSNSSSNAHAVDPLEQLLLHCGEEIRQSDTLVERLSPPGAENYRRHWLVGGSMVGLAATLLIVVVSILGLTSKPTVEEASARELAVLARDTKHFLSQSLKPPRWNTRDMEFAISEDCELIKRLIGDVRRHMERCAKRDDPQPG